MPSSLASIHSHLHPSPLPEGEGVIQLPPWTLPLGFERARDVDPSPLRRTVSFLDYFNDDGRTVTQSLCGRRQTVNPFSVKAPNG